LLQLLLAGLLLSFALDSGQAQIPAAPTTLAPAAPNLVSNAPLSSLSSTNLQDLNVTNAPPRKRGWLGIFGGEAKAKVIPPAPPLVLSPADKRISDMTIAGDQKYFDSLATKIAALQTRDGATNLYHRAKAAHWLYAAREQYDHNDRTLFIEEAVREATNLLARLETQPSPLPSGTPLIAHSLRVRQDLWDVAAHLKISSRFAEAEEDTARLEVQLVLAGHVLERSGWRAAKESIAAAEHYAASAAAAAGEEASVMPPTLTQSEDSRKARGVLSRRASLDHLQDRLARLNEHGSATHRYHWAKAQHWLDFARGEYDAQDRSGIIGQAADEAEKIIRLMENGSKDLPMDTPVVSRARRIRPDLWQVAADLKQHPSFAQVEDCVARLEVQLVWAGYESGTLGWRQARAFVQEAERFARQGELGVQARPDRSKQDHTVPAQP